MANNEVESIINRKNIAVFTGSRAEYGLLYWILKGLQESEVNLQLLVGGMHLSPEFGYTADEIEKDGFDITAKIECLLSSQTAVGTSKSVGLAIISAAEVLERIKPDIIVLLGDRFETFAIAQAAAFAQIPIAHIHGGELTQGAIDDTLRHCITKMAQLHFTSTQAYRQRVIQLGESPKSVFNVGAPGLDNLEYLPLLNREKLSAALNFELGEKFFLVTYHPVTLSIDGDQQALEHLLLALDNFSEYKVIITYPNADTFGRNLIEKLQVYQQDNPKRVLLASSLGQLNYLSAMKLTQAVIGNSSSGIIEAPSCSVPTVNIGERQKGRLASDSVLHCDGSYQAIVATIKQATSSSHLQHCLAQKNPYGSGGASKKIVDHIIDKFLNASKDQNKAKLFYDINSTFLADSP
jgi:UDP-hydrolysing UDP-N-acetyl-D-glucosamine 2-epimerase